MKLSHGRVSLWLHPLRPGEGLALLCLPELGASGADWDLAATPWPGPVHALDFAGHGRARPVRGGAYSSELLAGDADAALEMLGSAALVGAGLGAYVALLLAGARPDRVPGALLLPGRGLDGGGPAPDFDRDPQLAKVAFRPQDNGLDPLAQRHFQHELRPPDYVETYARAARRLLLSEDGDPRPPWWEQAAGIAGVTRVPVLQESHESQEPGGALRSLAEPLFP